MSLILDHVNGRPTDNRLENLRIAARNDAAPKARDLEIHDLTGAKSRVRRSSNCSVTSGR